MLRGRRGGSRSGDMMDALPFHDIRWVTYRNDSGEEIPAYALLRITGVATVNGQTLFTAAKPNASTTHLIWAFNSDIVVASGATNLGLCTFDFPAIAKINAGAAPVLNEMWGPTDAQWYIVRADSATIPLFEIHGKTTAMGDAVVVSRSARSQNGVGQSGAVIGAGATGNVTKYKWVAGVWTSMSVTETMRNTSATSIANGKKVSWIFHPESDQFLCSALEC